MRPIDDMQRQAVDLFCASDISLKNELHYGIIRLDKLEFDYLQLLVASLQCHNGGIATVVFDRIRLSKNERWNQL